MRSITSCAMRSPRDTGSAIFTVEISFAEIEQNNAKRPAVVHVDDASTNLDKYVYINEILDGQSAPWGDAAICAFRQGDRQMRGDNGFAATRDNRVLAGTQIVASSTGRSPLRQLGKLGKLFHEQKRLRLSRFGRQHFVQWVGTRVCTTRNGKLSWGANQVKSFIVSQRCRLVGHMNQNWTGATFSWSQGIYLPNKASSTSATRGIVF